MGNFRQIMFWALDRLKGGPIRRHLSDIENIFKNYHKAEVRERLSKYLRDTLQYAAENIEYYKAFQGCELAEFPVVNKQVIRDNESLFFNANYTKDKLFKQETSGSTGMPFAIYQDSLKRQRATADTLYFSHLAKYKLGQRLYFSRVWDKATRKGKWACFKQNWVIHDSSNLSEEKIEAFLSIIERDNSPKSVILFASTLSAITKYIQTNRISSSAKVESFITLSESLDLTTKKLATSQFKTNVISRYSNQELGIMAQQDENSDDFMLNVASFYFELLDFEKDIPVEIGQPGRIVVTDLFNRSMPLIRYDTGDIGIFKKTDDCEIPRLLTVEGRRVDFIYATNGNLVSPYVINTPMHEYQDISQYQFIQNGEKSYTILINLRPGIHSFGRETEMLKMLRSYIGSDAMIEVRYVNDIPVLKSGKRKQVVNNYKI